MSGIRIISLLSTLLAAVSCSRSQGVPEPSLSAAIANGKLNVTVTVPDRHHAYLDGGREGNLIPVTFDWKAWTADGLAEPKPAAQPEGVIDEESGARILRGQGVFAFELPADAAETKKAGDANFRVRVQICDEVKGICYRPAWHDVSPES
ncbi:protein-disulfide reductase DsbD family protein [Leptonema illini]|uniref:Uncharacterized protein n=1 Tax=Leptonema illini DSM 21528 TaxID=929563 RepID=H2CLT0_9LEPT|nr:protein-disulfide reductase DsbD family protein [Leptonema illini]EHQ04691.1 hypothetical protein Lepil_4213 [Leptonema illini DSM 21528]